MYAIVETGGKQYRVAEGDTVDVDRLDAAEGATVELDKVLLLDDGGNVISGKPYVEGAKVLATVKKNGRSEKIIVFKFKAKVRYRRKKGHHQYFTTLSIDKIVPPGEAVLAAPKRRRRKKEETGDGT